ncbi:MAG: hypothetical protein JOZ31_02015 [Verrucomicrobia bacterium]|nr:hypothetical protein [Verrucomicrobiota bacterium]MBV8481639.1 hypothetical protein [Verrucomicrobiota bacterium]
MIKTEATAAIIPPVRQLMRLGATLDSDFSVNVLRWCHDHFSPPALFEPSLANNLISVAAGSASPTRESIR